MRATGFEATTAYAAAAMKDLVRLEIDPTPENYTVWYHYHSKSEPKLTQIIDTLTSNKQKFSSERCAELYRQFFAENSDRAKVTVATGRIAIELRDLIEQLGLAGDEAANYGVALESFRGELAASDQAAGLANVVTSMLNATRDMEIKNRELEEKLTASSHQIGDLKGELDHMTRAALTDALTGIANRKQFDIEFERALLQSETDSTPLCLLVIDIDFFKRFNDTFGHAVGDQVLKLLAMTLNESIKGRDMAARYGGEEFVILLPETNLDGAVALADVIRERVRRKRIVNRSSGQDMGEITVSIGVGLYAVGETSAALFTRADAALYQAKNEGRNRGKSRKQSLS